MKKITIGRGRECDVRIDDSSDTVSRRQAVITFTPTGKMTIYDTSTNGTYVNGQKVPKPDGVPLKRSDHVNFAHVADLDWNMVKNPYRPSRTFGWIILTLSLLTCAVLLILAWNEDKAAKEETSPQTPAQNVTVEEPTDSLQLQVPKETPTATPVKATGNNTSNETVKKVAKPGKSGGGAVEELGNLPVASDGKQESEKPKADPNLEDALNQR